MTERSPERRPEEIEDEIARTRADMDSTLDAIQRRLSPSELVDQAMNYMKQNAAQEVMGGVGRAVRDNPIPLALIGVGCAWLLFSNAVPRRDDAAFGYSDGHDERRREHAADGPGGSLSAVRDGAARLAATAGEAASAAGGGVRGALRSAAEQSRHLGDYASSSANQVRRGYNSLLQERPLVLGAIGLAIGAAIGLLLPATRREDETLGEYRDQIFEQAQAAGREQVQKAQTVANEAWRAAKETVKEEAAKQGLAGTPQPEAKPARQQPAAAAALAE